MTNYQMAQLNVGANVVVGLGEKRQVEVAVVCDDPHGGETDWPYQRTTQVGYVTGEHVALWTVRRGRVFPRGRWSAWESLLAQM